ncbi:MAG: mannitol dehydrogenase family protein [Devosia sp.]
MMETLSPKTIDEVRGHVHRYAYDRSTIRPGIVHLGIGAFHRAHQAVVVDDLLSEDPSWGIVGASLRRPDTKDALAPQDGLYSLLVRDGGGTSARIIGSVVSLLDARRERDALLERLADPLTRLVSLTITEKGYCYNAVTSSLDETHPEIAADLADARNPSTAAGLIVEALRRRRNAGIAPFTVMSCDNLPNNGRVTARIVTDFAEAIDPALGAWVRTNVAFPGTMIDRIVPATTDADRAEALEMLGLEDRWPVVAEPFLQWVVEDRFNGRRPPLELGGAQFATDVLPYERMKLRMLNGAHSMMAYLGYLAGHEYVSQVVADPPFRRFIEGAWDAEIAPTLTMPPGVLEDYAAALMKRFSNPALKHRTYQIAMDGSQKLPQRLVGTIADRLRRGLPVDRLALGIAAWITYARGTDMQGKQIDVQDPHREDFVIAAGRALGDPEALLDNFLKLDRIFTEDVRNSRHFRRTLAAQYETLHQLGPAEAARRAA